MATDEELRALRLSLDDLKKSLQDFGTSLQATTSSIRSGAAASAPAASGGTTLASTPSSALGSFARSGFVKNLLGDTGSALLGGGEAAGGEAAAGPLGIAVAAANTLRDVAQAGFRGEQQAYENAPLFGGEAREDAESSFGFKEGLVSGAQNALDKVGLGFVLSGTKRSIERDKERMLRPIDKVAGNLSSYAEQLGEMGGELDEDAFQELADFELKRARRGEDFRERVTKIVNDVGLDPQQNGQLGVR